MSTLSKVTVLCIVCIIQVSIIEFVKSDGNWCFSAQQLIAQRSPGQSVVGVLGLVNEPTVSQVDPWICHKFPVSTGHPQLSRVCSASQCHCLTG